MPVCRWAGVGPTTESGKTSSTLQIRGQTPFSPALIVVECAMLSIILAMLLQLPAAAGIVPAKLAKAVSPLSPPNAVAGTCVLADVPVNRQGRVGEIKILRGLGAFTDSATTAIHLTL